MLRRVLGATLPAVVAGVAAGSAGTVGASASPITSLPAQPTFVGSPARAHPVRGIPGTPRNRFMAPNGTSEIHDDGWQTDTYRWGGPLGRSPQTLSTSLNADCGSITFDSRGRIVTVCVGLAGPTLYMLDPFTLETLAQFSLPPRQSVPPGGNIFQDFTGGGYFYLDHLDRVVTATTTHHIYVIAETGPTPGFRLIRDYDLSKVLSSSENITSALPDSHGRLWFVAKTDGVVGTLNFRTGAVHARRLGNGSLGEIENSFASGQRGALYIATNRKLYRFQARRSGQPRIAWQIRYPNSYKVKPGQVDDGTGTTPTVMPGGYVNITDNADPMDVMVYRTAVRLKRGQRRQVCRVPVFSPGASDTENSLIGAGRAMIVENNYGYSGPSAVSGGAVTAAGFERVDLNRNGKGCHVVWRNTTDAAPTVVPKLSLADGLIYTYTKGTEVTDPWYWTALDFRTGREVFKVLSGAGTGFNNNYAGLTLSRGGTAYLGTIGGMVALRDAG